jgi:hypothetical protein
MKKIIFASIFSITTIFADVITVLPYRGIVNYGNDSTKSVKDRASLYGIHANIGNLSYLFEADYSHIVTQYKDKKLMDLTQDDLTLTYAKYSKKGMFKYGAHLISTTDNELGNGIVGILTLEDYRFFGYDKVEYGLNSFYSFYKKGHNEEYEPSAISIFQVSPYMTLYKAINLNWGNKFYIGANLQLADKYIQKEYSSYEISDTILYKSFFVTFSYYNGEMRTGVKDAGYTVFNTLDMMKDGLAVKLGYYIKKNMLLNLSYGENNYIEYEKNQENKNNTTILSFKYGF